MAARVNSEMATNRAACARLRGRLRAIHARRSAGCQAGSACQERSLTVQTVGTARGWAIMFGSW